MEYYRTLFYQYATFLNANINRLYCFDDSFYNFLKGKFLIISERYLTFFDQRWRIWTFSTAFRTIFSKYFLKFDCCRRSTYISWSMDNDEHYVIFQNHSVDGIRTNGSFLINWITISHILDYIWMTCLIIFINISVTRDLTGIPTRSFHLPEWGIS